MCYLESKINLNISYGTQLIYVILRRQTKSSHQRFNSMMRTKCNECKKVEAWWCPSTLAGAFSPFFSLATISFIKWSSSSSSSQWMLWWYCKLIHCWTNPTSPRMSLCLAIFRCWNRMFKLWLCYFFSLEFKKQ